MTSPTTPNGAAIVAPHLDMTLREMLKHANAGGGAYGGRMTHRIPVKSTIELPPGQQVTRELVIALFVGLDAHAEAFTSALSPLLNGAATAPDDNQAGTV